MTKERNNDESKPSVESSENSRIEHDIEHADSDSNYSNYYLEAFNKIWRASTSDNRLTLFELRRYRTTHLLNLRFLETKINEIDHNLNQAGLHQSQPPDREHTLDRLGLKHCKKNSKAVKIKDVVNRNLIIRLRQLIKEYGSFILYALISN